MELVPLETVCEAPGSGYSLRPQTRELVFARAGEYATRAILPRKGSPGAAAYDLFTPTDIRVSAGRMTVVPTGWSVRLPRGKYLKIESRSGLAARGIVVVGGVVDSDYSGEIRVVLHNLSQSDIMGAWTANAGDRIAQAIVMDCMNHLEPVEADTLPPLDEDLVARGSGGFGSTGA